MPPTKASGLKGTALRENQDLNLTFPKMEARSLENRKSAAALISTSNSAADMMGWLEEFKGRLDSVGRNVAPTDSVVLPPTASARKRPLVSSALRVSKRPCSSTCKSPAISRAAKKQLEASLAKAAPVPVESVSPSVSSSSMTSGRPQRAAKLAANKRITTQRKNESGGKHKKKSFNKFFPNESRRTLLQSPVVSDETLLDHTRASIVGVPHTSTPNLDLPPQTSQRVSRTQNDVPNLKLVLEKENINNEPLSSSGSEGGTQFHSAVSTFGTTMVAEPTQGKSTPKADMVTRTTAASPPGIVEVPSQILLRNEPRVHLPEVPVTIEPPRATSSTVIHVDAQVTEVCSVTFIVPRESNGSDGEMSETMVEPESAVTAIVVTETIEVEAGTVNRTVAKKSCQQLEFFGAGGEKPTSSIASDPVPEVLKSLAVVSGHSVIKDLPVSVPAAEAPSDGSDWEQEADEPEGDPDVYDFTQTSPQCPPGKAVRPKARRPRKSRKSRRDLIRKPAVQERAITPLRPFGSPRRRDASVSIASGIKAQEARRREEMQEEARQVAARRREELNREKQDKLKKETEERNRKAQENREEVERQRQAKKLEQQKHEEMAEKHRAEQEAKRKEQKIADNRQRAKEAEERRNKEAADYKKQAAEKLRFSPSSSQKTTATKNLACGVRVNRPPVTPGITAKQSVGDTFGSATKPPLVLTGESLTTPLKAPETTSTDSRFKRAPSAELHSTGLQHSGSQLPAGGYRALQNSRAIFPPVDPVGFSVQKTLLAQNTANLAAMNKTPKPVPLLSLDGLRATASAATSHETLSTPQIPPVPAATATHPFLLTAPQPSTPRPVSVPQGQPSFISALDKQIPTPAPVKPLFGLGNPIVPSAGDNLFRPIPSQGFSTSQLQPLASASTPLIPDSSRLIQSKALVPGPTPLMQSFPSTSSLMHSGGFGAAGSNRILTSAVQGLFETKSKMTGADKAEIGIVAFASSQFSKMAISNQTTLLPGSQMKEVVNTTKTASVEVYTNYGLDIQQDDDTDDEDSPKRQIPNWATDKRLIPEIRRQLQTEIDLDFIFRGVRPQEKVNLGSIFRMEQHRYNRRTSSQMWPSGVLPLGLTVTQDSATKPRKPDEV